MMKIDRIVVFSILVLVCVLGRNLPHPPNVTPITGAALFAGCYFASPWVAAALPITAMLTADSFIGFGSLSVTLVVYAAFLLPLLFRPWLRRRASAPRVITASLGSSLAFFLFTNAAVWASGDLYERTLAGLGGCYAAALPFYRSMVLGDLFWSGAFFGIWAVAASRVARRAEARAVVERGPDSRR